EPLEHRERHARVEPQALHRRDKSVTPERRRIPWNSRVGISPLWSVGQQDGEVRGRPPQNFIEHLVGGINLGADPDHLLQFAVGGSQALQEWRRRLGPIAIAGDRAKKCETDLCGSRSSWNEASEGDKWVGVG